MSAAFDQLRRLLMRTSGLALDSEKVYLAETRLRPLMQSNRITTLDELMQRIETPGNGELLRQIVEAMTTNETFFFRDRVPFDNFKKIMLPSLLQNRAAKRRIRIWCAAASTGQEPYSLAMMLDEEVRRLMGWQIDILATDISHAVIDVARAGRYSQFEVQRGLPIALLLRYFQREGESWRINEYLRSRVRFEQFNLLSDFGSFGTFDVIFCRNVLIYMDIETKHDILKRMARALAPDGYFVMGSAESVVGLCDSLMPDPTHQTFNVLAAPKSRRGAPMALAAL